MVKEFIHLCETYLLTFRYLLKREIILYVYIVSLFVLYYTFVTFLNFVL